MEPEKGALLSEIWKNPKKSVYELALNPTCPQSV